MKSKISKVTLLILIFALVLTTMLVPMSAFAGTATGYDSADDVEYVTSGQYIYNWGARGETATFLSPNAEKFYTGSYTFANLSQVSGGTSQSTAPSSALYKQLQKLMTDKHTHQTTYGDIRYQSMYTDCQNGGGAISSFYSGKSIGPSWDGSWNREHTWPSSKSISGRPSNDSDGDSADIMSVRPTSTSENSSRSNTAYGQSSGYYNPNSESGGKYDLRGDVARICLYVYTRWGNTGSMWGSSGVMESLDVLLEWMEADPVDTWELGRNDSVESITGTRNVFVDYPEYAFLLFGEAVPENYPTPSQSNGVTPPDIQEHTCQFSQATCTEPATCSICYATSGSALGHTTPDADGLCTRCGEVLEVKTTHAGTQADPYTVADALKVGAALNGGSGTNVIYVQGVVTSIGTISSKGTYREKIVIKDSSTEQTLNISTANPGPNENLDIQVGDTLLLWGYLRTNNSSGLPEMGSVNGTYVYYSVVTGSQGGGTTHTCVFGDATCTSPATCTCGETQGTALGHTTTNGTCTRCGVAVGSGNQGGQTSQGTSIDLTKEYNKVSASGTKLEFATGDLKVTVDKASSTTDLVDKTADGYSARVYAGATLTVEYPQMTKIVINCDSYSYGDKTYYSGFDGMEIAGATITRNELVITITFDQPTDKFVSGSMASQTRILSVEVFTSSNSGQGGGTTHTCVFGNATCTSPATCTCGETQGTALGHTTTNGTCTRCGVTVGSGNQGGQTSQSASIDLTSASNKVSASSQKLEFATGDLKVTVDKANSTTDLVDKTGDGYSARVYAGATLTVEYPQMTKIVINCDSYSYGDKTYYSGFDGMEIAGATITRNELVITITFDQPTDKFVSGSMASQTRILSVEVFTSSNSGQGGGTTHTCVFGDATCTSPATCTCGETQGTALGHTTTNGTCTRCGVTVGSGNQGGTDTPVTPDPTVEAFKTAVVNIQNATTMQQKFDAIKVALQQYNALNDTQKAQVTTEFETLKTEVANYNTQATTQNTNSNSALTLAITLVSLVAAAVALAFVKKVF